MTDLSIFEEDASSAPVDDNAVAAMRKTADEMLELSQNIEDAEELVKKMKAHYNALSTTVLPEKMAAVGLNEFATQEGYKLKIEQVVAGTLPKDERREEAIETLKEMGAEDLIKSEMKIVFNRSEHNEAVNLYEKLSESGYLIEFKSDVNPMTYSAFFRDKLKKGEEFDPKLMNIYVGNKTKVTKPKEK